MYPNELCEAILRGVVNQKKEDHKIISMPMMNSLQLRGFVGSIGGRNIQSIVEEQGKTSPLGNWPEGWHDPVHELDGGDDRFGPRPQRGIDIFVGRAGLLDI